MSATPTQQAIDYRSVRLVSFDIWKTLIIAHPDYRLQRDRHLATSFDRPLASVQVAMRKADIELDDLAESTGRDQSPQARLIRAAQLLGLTLGDDEATRLAETVQETALTYLPLLIEANLTTSLQRLKDLDLETAFVSNTGFLPGTVMREILGRLGLAQFASVLLFSNEVGASKPDPAIFQALEQATGLTGQTIVHLGDSLRADIEGAHAAGLQAELIGDGATIAEFVDRLAEARV